MTERIDVAQLNTQFVGDLRQLSSSVKDAQKLINQAFGQVIDAADQVADGFNEVEEESKNFQSSATELNSKIQLVERGYDMLKQTIAGAVDLAQLGAQSERVEDRFTKFANTIGSTDEILASFNRGAGGTVDQLTAMNAAGSLIQQNLVGTAGEMERVVEFATRLGDQTASATDRINAFSQLLRNQSIQLLDNFGISSGRVRAEIEKLQAADAALSREEAFRIAVFSEGQKSLDVLGERVDDNAAKMERAQARMQDFRVEMGQKMVPIISTAAEVLSSLDSATIALATTLAGAMGTLVKFSGGLGGLNEKLGVTPGQFAAVGAAAFALIGVYQQLRDVQNRIEEGQAKVNATLDTWQEKTAQAVAEGQDMGSVVQDLAGKVNKADEVLHANAETGNILKDALQDAATAAARASKENEIMSAAAANARESIVSQSGSVEEANNLIGIYNSEITNSKAAISEMTALTYAQATANWELVKSLADSDSLLDKFRRTQAETFIQGNKLREENTRLVEEETKKAEELAQKTLSLADAYKVAAGGVEEGGRSFEMVEIALGQVSQAEVKLQNDLELLGRAFSLGAISADEMTARLREAEAGTLDLTFAERKMLNETSDAIIKAREDHAIALENEKKALEEARQAELDRIETQQQAIQSQLELSETLLGADEQRIASAAIDQLKQAQEAGLITFEDFTKAVVEVQDRFGLADDRSRALTLGLGELVNEFAGGGIAANEFDDALDILIKDAEDGVVAFDNLKKQIDDVRNATEETVRVFNAATGQFEDMAVGGGGERTFNAATGEWGAGGGMATSGPTIIDALTGQVVSAPQQQPAAGGVNIYGGLHLEGIQNVDDFLAQLQALTPTG